MPRSRYDDDDDDRPRRRRRRDDDDHDPGRGGGGLPVGLIVGGGVGAALLVVGLLVILLVGRKAPQPEAAENAPDPAPAARLVPGRPAGGGDPANPFPPPPKKAGVGTPLPPDTPGAKALAFAGGEDGVVGVVGMPPEGAGEVLTVAKVKSGELVGRVQIDAKDVGYGFAVAPGGKYAAVKGSGPFEGDPVILADLPSGKTYRFTPYSKKGAITNPGLVGFGFTAPDRLLTVHETSGFDVWQLPGMQRVCGQPGRPPSSIPFVGSNAFSQSPVNFGLSADGKSFAVFDGSGFSFHDTATATRTARTEAILPPNIRSMNFWGAAFNAAGTRFACLCTTHTPRTATTLFVWDPATGTRVSGAAVSSSRYGTGFGWWGPDHIAVWQGGNSTAEVMHVASGEFVANVGLGRVGGQQSIATSTPGDRLWYTYGEAGLAAGGMTPRLVSVPAPPALPGKLLTLDPDGGRWQ